MTDKTKAVNLTEDEISTLISNHGAKLSSRDFDDITIDRINYLNKRLKSFKEPDTEVKSDPQFTADVKAEGWGTQQNG